MFINYYTITLLKQIKQAQLINNNVRKSSEFIQGQFVKKYKFI